MPQIFRQKIGRFIQMNELVQPGSSLIVAVSGGGDSVALLTVLTEMEELRLSLVVAHLNHCLRGEESDTDEEFVRQLARRHDLPFVSKRVDVAYLAGQKRLSLEEAGREARYQFFAEVAAASGASVTALAHHADDQAETVLMRLIRGSSATGLCGMRPKTVDGRYIRPLLSTSRKEIEGYLSSSSISYRTDSSNADTRFFRNSIRHELFPFLRKYNPAVSVRLATTATALASDELLLRELTLQAAGRLRVAGPEEISFDVDRLRGEHKGLRMRLYRHAIEETKSDLAHISARNLEDIDRLIISSRSQGRLNLPCSLTVSRTYDRLTFQLGQVRNQAPFEIIVDGPGDHHLADGRVFRVIHLQAVPVALDSTPSKAFFDQQKTPFPWIVRSWRPGDRFRPLGMEGSRKIKDIFIDMKVPHQMRKTVPLIVAGNRIVWIGGLKAGEDARIRGCTAAAVTAEILDITD